MSGGRFGGDRVVEEKKINEEQQTWFLDAMGMIGLWIYR